MQRAPLFCLTPAGLYCEAGDFYVDPWGPVERAVTTHAHADHARAGCEGYLTTAEGLAVLRTRLGPEAGIETLAYGEPAFFDGVRVSLHPAGHILGSAQVRAEYQGETWVISGDYKPSGDRTYTPFEPLRCHTFVTESTFGLPIYRWSAQNDVFDEINQWWRQNQSAGQASLLFGYALGKAQRILAGVDSTIGPICTHGAVEAINHAYRESGVSLPPTTYASAADPKTDWTRALVMAPPSAQRSPWVRRFGEYSSGFASGWMLVRGARRRRAIDRGFVLSDHADWPELLQTIEATGAKRVLVTHGYVGPMVRWLQENGLDADSLETRFEGEQDDSTDLDVLEPENSPSPG